MAIFYWTKNVTHVTSCSVTTVHFCSLLKTTNHGQKEQQNLEGSSDTLQGLPTQGRGFCLLIAAGCKGSSCDNRTFWEIKKLKISGEPAQTFALQGTQRSQSSFELQGVILLREREK